MNQVPALNNSAVNLLKSRAGQKKIRDAYISKNLDAMASEWLEAQKDILQGTEYADLLNRGSFTVNASELKHSHSKTQRFIDMKRIYGRKQKPLKVHNTQLYITMNRLIFRLRYGFTEMVKNEIAQTIEM
jgi:hypothetical protein